MREWKDLEAALIERPGGMTTAQAVARGYLEGLAIQALEHRCDAIGRKLDPRCDAHR
jgi:hypothetical protein